MYCLSRGGAKTDFWGKYAPVKNVPQKWRQYWRHNRNPVKAKEIEKGTHESLLYQHNTKPLLHAVWADNNFVKTLSNFHSPTIVAGGMKRRGRDPITKKGQENKVMLIVMNNRLTTARLTIRLIKGMAPKLSMIYRLNLIYMVGLWS
jgi:hypothetical protein